MVQPANIKFLCHMEGNILADLSNYNVSVASSGTTTSSTVYKYGNGSVLFAGSSSNRLSMGSSANYALGSSSFTIEAWAYFTGAASGYIFSTSDGSSKFSALFGWSGTSLSFTWTTTGSDTPPGLSFPYSPPLNTWVHLCAERNGSTLTIYVNGVSQASMTMTATVWGGGTFFYLGNNHVVNSVLSGYLDDVRLTIGEAVYGGPFTPPTSALPLPQYPPGWSVADVTANGATLSNNGFTLTTGNWSSYNNTRTGNGIVLQSSKKSYIEFSFIQLKAAGGGNQVIGLVDRSQPTVGLGGTNRYYITNTAPGVAGAFTSSFSITFAPVVGDVWAFAYDPVSSPTTSYFWVAKNNVWFNSGNPAAGPSTGNPSGNYVGNLAIFPHFTSLESGDVVTMNSVAGSFKYAPPSGFTAWDVPGITPSKVGSAALMMGV